MKGKTGYEITTYRIDGEYKDCRHPENVEFSSDLKDDLKRRDFTINAMAYNDSTGLVDEFDGINDLNKGIIRCVGDAKERLSYIFRFKRVKKCCIPENRLFFREFQHCKCIS